MLRGRFDEGAPTVEEHIAPAGAPRPGLAGAAIGLLLVGSALTFLAQGILLAIGVVLLGAFVVTGVVELLRPEAFD